MTRKYYSENWFEATDKFVKNARANGDIKWCVANKSPYDIPYVTIGHGPNKVVINSGIHGIEGFFGSAAQNMFLDMFAKRLSPEILSHYTIVLIHVINGWGMQNRMREVQDMQTGGLVDLNRNYGVDFSQPAKLPKNRKYMMAHHILLSLPDPVRKKNEIKEYRKKHLNDGAWDAISFGQYEEPFGLFYGGRAPCMENKMTMHIYDNIMTSDTQSLTSIGLHTGLGRFYRKRGIVTGDLMVSHPRAHSTTKYFDKVFCATNVVSDERAVNGPMLQGDLVDALEARYADRFIPIYTADLEIGTGEFPVMSPIYKRMDMGDARYDLLHGGQINPVTWNNLTESWYPSDEKWRNAALVRVHVMFSELVNAMRDRIK